MDNATYYQRNTKIMLNRVKNYYENDKERLRVQKCNKLKNIAIVHVKKSTYRIYFRYMSKREVKKLMTNSNLIYKKGAL